MSNSYVGLSIEPLPDAEEDTQIGNSPFIYGYYGLEACFVRGFVRISNKRGQPLSIDSLRISFVGFLRLSYTNETNSTSGGNLLKTLVSVSEQLLDKEECPPNGVLDIPFQLSLPDPSPSQPELVKQAVRTANLLPPNCKTKGYTYSGSPFEFDIVYSLSAELTEPPVTIFPMSLVTSNSIPTIKVKLDIDPFIAHDPRQLPLVMQPDSKRWRSAPGDTPVEYEIEIGATTFGPEDKFNFMYRLAVARDAAASGVRVKRVSLILREHRTLGSTISSLVPPAHKCVRSSGEITRWEFDEVEPPTSEELRLEESDDSEEYAFAIDFDNEADWSELGADDSARARLETSESPITMQQLAIDDGGMDARRKRLYTRIPRRQKSKAKGKTPRFKAGLVEMSELRPRRKLADGMTFYTPSHLQSTNAYTYDTGPIRGPSSGFSDGWSSGPGGDGLYVENQVEIILPKRALLRPSSFKVSDPQLIYPNPHNHPYTPLPYVEVKHTLQVRIELKGVDKPIIHECWATVATVGKKECEGLLDHRIELMPSLDYDKIFGNDIWVPRYEPLCETDASETKQEDDADEFFGPLAPVVKSLRGLTTSPSIRQSKRRSASLTRNFTENIGKNEKSRSRPPSLGPSLSSSPNIRSGLASFIATTPFNDHNYFQKRPSISSILSFASHNAGNSANASPENSDDEDCRDFRGKKLSEDGVSIRTRTAAPGKQDGSSPKKAATIPPNMGPAPIITRSAAFQPPPRLLSAHSLIASDARVVADFPGDPTSQRLLVEIQAYKRNLHYPQTRVDRSPSPSRSDDFIEHQPDNLSKEASADFIRHPLLGEEEVEARRREAAAKQLARSEPSALPTSARSIDDFGRPPPVGEGEVPPMYRE